MMKYKEELVNSIKAYSAFHQQSDRESFFQIYCEKIADSDFIEDYSYLFFKGKGSRNRSIQIDGYSYNKLDDKLTLFIIPSLSYYENPILTFSDALTLFNRAKYFYFDSEKILTTAEESTEGYGLAYDIYHKNIEIKTLDIIILTDYSKSNKINYIEPTIENNIQINYSIFDLTRIKVIDDSSYGKETLTINLKKEFNHDGIPVLPASKNSEYQAYLCNISGELLAKMYNKYQSRLLEGNVRSFLQTKGKVNKGIRSTILNQPEMFFAFNNGIAATAEELKIITSSEGLFITEFKGLQIVNGGQTTASLANSWENDSKLDSHNQIKKIYVPMKVSVVSLQAAEDLIPNISKYANSQNKVSDADLASNHSFHIKIEELSRKLHAPALNGAQFGTYWYYERANGQYRQETYKSTDSFRKKFESKNPKNQLFKKVDLAKYMNIYLKKPHIASAGSQKSFNTFSNWMIKKWDKNPNFVNDEFFKKVVSLAILFRKTDSIIRRQQWFDSYKANIIAYTLSLIFYKVEVDFTEKTIDFNEIWKKQDISIGWIKQLETVSYHVYKHLISKDREIENVTEWAKRELSWKIAQEIQFNYHEDFINDLVDKDIVVEQESEAIKDQKELNELNSMIKVYEYGADFWREVYKWGTEENILTSQDIKLLNVAISIESGKIPNDKQSLKILKILDKVRENSFPK